MRRLVKSFAGLIYLLWVVPIVTLLLLSGAIVLVSLLVFVWPAVWLRSRLIQPTSTDKKLSPQAIYPIIDKEYSVEGVKKTVLRIIGEE